MISSAFDRAPADAAGEEGAQVLDDLERAPARLRGSRDLGDAAVLDPAAVGDRG